jgi:translation initiation factor 2 beta subunit (eIF-2beta)/eIF-5
VESYHLAGRARAQSADGARNRNRTILRNSAQEIDYDCAHEHEESEIHITNRYFSTLTARGKGEKSYELQIKGGQSWQSFKSRLKRRRKQGSR